MHPRIETDCQTYSSQVGNSIFISADLAAVRLTPTALASSHLYTQETIKQLFCIDELKPTALAVSHLHTPEIFWSTLGSAVHTLHVQQSAA